MKSNAQSRRHHTLFTRTTWDSQFPSKKLRSTPELIVVLDDDAHEALHRAIPTVPVPDHRSLQIIENRFQPVTGGIIKNLYNLISEIDNVTQRSYVGRIEQELGAVVIHSLEMQMPFLREGAC